MRALLICVLALAVEGCGDAFVPPADGLHITPSSRSVSPGSTVSITLENRSSAVLTENLCPIELQLHRDTGWGVANLDPGPGLFCPEDVRVFLPGSVLHRSVQLSPALAAGEYRVLFGGLFLGSGKPLPEEARASESFFVQP